MRDQQAKYLDTFPNWLRNLGDDAEKLATVLGARGVEWIAMDTTVLFAAPPTSEAERDGWAKKPRLPRRVLPLTGRDPGLEALDLANEVLGNGFLSRLNMDLREDKGWSYGVRSSVSSPQGPRTLMLVAPVQSDRTGDSIRLILKDMAAFPAARGVDPVELARVTDGNIRGLPNRFETNSQVLGAIVLNERLGRADDYYTTLPARYRAIDGAAIDGAAREWLTPQGLVFVVVGDRKLVEPQLKGLGLPVELAPTPPVDSKAAAGE